MYEETTMENSNDYYTNNFPNCNEFSRQRNLLKTYKSHRYCVEVNRHGIKWLIYVTANASFGSEKNTYLLNKENDEMIWRQHKRRGTKVWKTGTTEGTTQLQHQRLNYNIKTRMTELTTINQSTPTMKTTSSPLQSYVARLTLSTKSSLIRYKNTSTNNYGAKALF